MKNSKISKSQLPNMYSCFKKCYFEKCSRYTVGYTKIKKNHRIRQFLPFSTPLNYTKY